MSLSEIANTLRSAVTRNLGDSEWLQKLHEFRAETEHRDRNGSKERGYSNGSFSVGGLENIRSGRLPKNQISRIAANVEIVTIVDFQRLLNYLFDSLLHPLVSQKKQVLQRPPYLSDKAYDWCGSLWIVLEEVW